MAYLPESELERQRRMQEAQTSGAGSNTQQVSGPSGVISAGSTSGAPGKKGPASSGRWTNLNSYLDANKEQATQMGDKIGTNIEGAGTAARGQINTASTDFANEVKQGSINDLDKAQSDAQGIVNKAKSAAMNAQIAQPEVDRFKEVKTAAYKGPTDVMSTSGYQPLLSQVQKVQDLSKQSASETGRQALLKDTYGTGGQYTAGMSTLDNLLLQGDKAAQDRLAQARTNVGDVQGLFDSYVSSGDELAKATGQKHTAARTAANSYLGRVDDPTTPEDESAGAFSDVNSAVRTKQNELKTKADTAKSNFGNGGYSEAELKDMFGDDYFDAKALLEGGPFNTSKLGFSDAKGIPKQENFDRFGILLGVDPREFYKTDDNITWADAATDDNRAQMAALTRLAEQDLAPMYSESANYVDPSLDKEGMNKARTQKLAELKQDIADWSGSHEGRMKMSDKYGYSASYMPNQPGVPMDWFQTITNMITSKNPKASSGYAKKKV